MTNIRSASSAYIIYGYESVFQGGASIFNLFGKRQNGSGLEWSNNQLALPNLDTPEIKNFLYNKNEGTISMDYVLSNPWWLTAILNDYYNNPVLSNGVYTYQWDSDPSVNLNIKQPKTINIHIGERLDTAELRSALGCVTPTLTIKSSINNPIEITQTLDWGKESPLSTSLDNSLPTDANFTPYSFVHGDFELPNSTILSNVQDFDITFDTGAELIWGHGSPDATDRYNKILNMTGRVQIALKDSTLLQDVINRSELATLRIFISNGLSGANLKSIELLFTGVGISSHRTIGLAPGELLLEEISFQCRNILATAKNSISPPPY